MRRRDMLLAGAALGMAGSSRAQVADLNDAINKAGRQRMLSQRMAKSYLAAGQGVEPELAARTLAASMALFDRQLIELKAYAPNADIKATYLQLDVAWDDYKAQLMGDRPGRANAETVMSLAARVLKLAHDGTSQLEKTSSRPAGKLVNLSGRQRMLSQRMAAHYLSACWDVQATACTAEIARSREEFIAAHELLKNAPQATPAIRSELNLAGMQWTFFDNALRTVKPGAADKHAMGNVFTASERILQVMDDVTGMVSKLG